MTKTLVCMLGLSIVLAAPMASAANRAPAASLEDQIYSQANGGLPREAISYAVQYLNQNAGRSVEGKRLRSDRMIIVNYDQSNYQPRLYYIKMNGGSVSVSVHMTSHGRGDHSGYPAAGEGVPRYFSDSDSSYLSPLGFMITGSLYRGSKDLMGRHVAEGNGRQSMYLYGLEKHNHNTGRGRDVIMHAAGYVTASRAGMSWGCITLDGPTASRILPEIANGTLIYSYSSRDPKRGTGKGYL